MISMCEVAAYCICVIQMASSIVVHDRLAEFSALLDTTVGRDKSGR
jgi:hypothetical protein